MKRLYKYRLVYNGGWHFELLPNNNNNQYVGKSDTYPTKDETMAALRKFKSFLSGKNTVAYEIKLVSKESVIGSNRYSGSFAFSENGEMFSTRPYEHRYEVKNGIRRILKHFDSQIRTDLERKQK